MFHVTMVADMETYYANNGILDQALNIVCVRRDYPGVSYVAKIDPHAHMLDEPPLPAPETDQEMTGYVSEEREFDMLGFGAKHEGAAEYYILAAFAKWISDPVALTIENQKHSLPAVKTSMAPPPAKDVAARLPEPPPHRNVLARIVGEKEPSIDGSLRVAKRQPRFPMDPPPPAFVTIVAVRLVPTGGVFAHSLELKPVTKGNELVAQFSIPLKTIVPKLEPGPYRILVFSADEKAAPMDIVIPKQ